jgi:hypothetical protein
MEIMKDPGRLPFPLLITVWPTGEVKARRTSWAAYHRANPKVEFYLCAGKVASRPARATGSRAAP